MADVAPSNLMNNQPIGSLTPEQAGARRAELMANPEFSARIAARDSEAFAEHTRLWRVEHNMTPEPQAPATPEDVRSGMLERDLQLDDARLAVWERNIRMDDQMRFEHRRGLVTKQQSEDAQREIERMKRDRAFGARVLAGDQDAVDRWMRFGRIASMQVAPDDYKW